MLRVLVYVILVFLFALGFAWLADRPGSIELAWQGYQFRTSLMVGAIGLAALIVAAILVAWLLRALLKAPRRFERFLGERRRERGYRLLTTGMVALGAGDAAGARKAAEDSRLCLGDEPLPLLLGAQAAQLAGDGRAARAAFERLAARKDTRALGLRGLFIEARRQGDHEAARHFAEEAVQAAPRAEAGRIGWAGTALFEYQSREGDWLAAMRTLAANQKARLVDKPTADRLRAVLLAAQAMEQEAGEPEEARASALEALRLSPGLTPAAAVAGRVLTRAGEVGRAARVLEAAWKVMPHPDIAEAYAAVRPGDLVRDRLRRMRRLSGLRANHPEGAMAVARAAIDARDWPAARSALDGLLAARPSERVCLLMAEIEEREHGDRGAVRAWLTRAINAPRDPAWVADGQAFDRWMPVSPVSGAVGTFAWAVPPEVPAPREAIEIQSGVAPEAPPVAQIEARATADGPAPVTPAAEVGQPAVVEAEAPPPTAEAPPAVVPAPPPAAVPAASPAADAGGAPAEPAAGTPATPAAGGPKGNGADRAETAGGAAPAAAAGAGEAAPEAETAPAAETAPEAAAPLPPRAPDDPGPEAGSEEEEPRRRRFGVF